MGGTFKEEKLTAQKCSKIISTFFLYSKAKAFKKIINWNINPK